MNTESNHGRDDQDERSSAAERRLAAMELRLRRLAPRPVSFTAGDVLAAATEASLETKVAEHANSLERPAERRAAAASQWLTLTAASGCGAVAGVAATCLVFWWAGAAAGTEAGGRGPDQPPPLGPRPVGDLVGHPQEPRPDPAGRGDAQPQWSRSEQLLSAGLFAREQAGSTGVGPLRATSHVRDRLTLTGRELGPVADWDADDLPASETLPVSASDRQRLLDELLGDDESAL